MCSPKQCKECGKTGWVGCGLHVEEVMRDVPKADQCKCEKTNTSLAGLFQKLFNR